MYSVIDLQVACLLKFFDTNFRSMDDSLGDLSEKIPFYKFYKHESFLLYVFVDASVRYFDLKIFRYKLRKYEAFSLYLLGVSLG